MHLVREWIWYAFKDIKMTSLHPPSVYNDHFIPDFMATCTLAHDLDFTKAVDYVPEMEVYCPKVPPPCLIRDGRFYIVRDFVMFHRYESPWSLRYGCYFMR